MAVARDISAEEAEWIRRYGVEVAAEFGGEFERENKRFAGGPALIDRFEETLSAMVSHGRSLISGVDEAHNELCVASQMLASRDPHFTRLEYEPALPGCAKSIDFRASDGDDLLVYVDVKTIKPKPKDRWDQFEKAVEEGWFPENVRVGLAEEWLGGELWHGMFTARSRMLEHTLALEAKIRDGKLADDGTFFVLILCGEGFHWHQDGLEDFVSFYGGGRHRADDPFSKAEANYILDKKVVLDRTITRFGCLSRHQFELRQNRLNWNVRPPSTSMF